MFTSKGSGDKLSATKSYHGEYTAPRQRRCLASYADDFIEEIELSPRSKSWF